METFVALYICMSGATCPGKMVTSSSYWYSLESCEKDARLVAQGMFVSSGDKYGFKCVTVDYEPPNLTPPRYAISTMELQSDPAARVIAHWTKLRNAALKARRALLKLMAAIEEERKSGGHGQK